MSLLFTLMLQCSSLRGGRTWGPYHPVCCPVSMCLSIDFSDKARNHFSTLLHPLPLRPVCLILYLFLSVYLSLSHISGRARTHTHTHAHSLSSLSSMFEKGARVPQLSWWYTFSTWRCPWVKNKKVHKIAITCIKYRLFHRCFMKMRIRACLKHTDDKSSLSFN